MDFTKTSVVFCNIVVRTVGSFGDVCILGWGWGMVGGAFKDVRGSVSVIVLVSQSTIPDTFCVLVTSLDQCGGCQEWLGFFPSFSQPRKYRLGMLEERLVPMGSKARKAKNPIGCLADRCKSGVPINMVWWNRVTENNLQVKILFLDIFESEYFGCFLCLCGVVGMRLDGLADVLRFFF